MGFFSREPSVSTFKFVSNTCIEVDLGVPPKMLNGATKIKSNLYTGIGWSILEHRDGGLYVSGVKVDPKDGSTLHPNFLQPLMLHQSTMIPESWNVHGTCVYFRGVIFGDKNDTSIVQHITRGHTQWFDGVEINNKR